MHIVHTNAASRRGDAFLRCSSVPTAYKKTRRHERGGIIAHCCDLGDGVAKCLTSWCAVRCSISGHFFTAPTQTPSVPVPGAIGRGCHEFARSTAHT